MQCTRSADTETMERYLHGRLSAAAEEAFEIHLFECAACSDELTRLGALRAELARRRAEIEAAEAPARLLQRLVWLPLAALLLVGLGLVLYLPRGRAVETASLVSFEAPAYRPARLRGAVGEAEETFREAMERYQKGDHEGAAKGLEAALALDPDRVDIWFFLGASLLLTDRAENALDPLGRVVDTGDVQYLEEALYLRAQAFLLRGDAASAGADLRSIVELAGGWEERARRQLEVLEARTGNGE